MKALLTAAAVIALVSAFAAPASAQQAHDQTAAKHANGGQCAISQAMLAAIADNKEQHMAETKSRIDSLIANALATARTPRAPGSPTMLSKSPVILGKGSPNG
ncbi:MAG: hypothetical protein GKS02_00720 [Alphaproteobacteria bacterium]|nr:hypothetical protein [Alphaproteobacteria bacterium]